MTGWDACLASVKCPAAGKESKPSWSKGLQKPGDLQNGLGFHLGQPAIWVLNRSCRRPVESAKNRFELVGTVP